MLTLTDTIRKSDVNFIEGMALELVLADNKLAGVIFYDIKIIY